MTGSARIARLAAVLSCSLLGVATAQPALAATRTTTMGVTATVVDDCSVTATNVAFGNVNVITAGPATATGGIVVRCTLGTPWTVTASVGSGAGATTALRRMRLATDLTKTLNYSLYTDSAYLTVWGDGATGTSIAGTGTGNTDARTIYARVPTGQTGASRGSYSDAVTVTVTY